MGTFYKLKIKDKKKETTKAVSISFSVPNDLKPVFSFKAGQYITLKKDFNGIEIRRDYSLCVSPQSQELKVTVKEVSDGIFSKFANTTLKVGDVLEVAPPTGRFVFEPDPSKSRTIAAFAAGSGITPVLSIIKTVMEEEPKSNFILVYGNKTINDTIFYDELLGLQNKYGDRFSIQFVFSQSQEKDALFGRIEKSTVNYIVNNKHKDIIFDAFYLCGPEHMIKVVSDTLKERGIEDAKILFELFTTSSPSEPIDNASTEGKTKITVLIDDEETSFEMSQKETILEAALAHNIDAPYSCQGGICSSCLARLTQGEATMRQNNILTDSEVAEGLILTCQAQPTTPAVYVDYDNV